MVLLVIGLEVVFGVFDVALHLRGEQHVGAQVVAVARAVVGSIAHGEREVVVALIRYLQAQLHLLEGDIAWFVGGGGHRRGGKSGHVLRLRRG